jgi:DNA-binding response OmpR family regulator
MQAAALCAGAEYLAKPFRLEALESRVRALTGRR